MASSTDSTSPVARTASPGNPGSLTSRPGFRLRAVTAGVVLAAVTASAGWWAWRRWQDESRAELRHAARQAAEARRWEELAAGARRLTQADPHDGQAWLWRAQAARGLRDYAQSAKYLQQIPRGEPHERTAQQALVAVDFGELNQPLAGARVCEEMLADDPRSELAHQRLIFFYALTLQRQPLARLARRAIELHCEPLEAYVYLFFLDSLHFTNGSELNRRWLAGAPGSELFTAAHAVHLANTLEGGAPRDDIEVVRSVRRLAAGKAQALAELLQRFPDNLELLAWHLEQAFEAGDVDRAIELLAALPASADGDNRCWRYAGWVHTQRDEFEQADADYARALRVNPLDHETRHLLADLRRRQRRFDEVATLEGLAQEARRLRRALEHLPDVRSAGHELLGELADYADRCGDATCSRGLRRRIAGEPLP